MLYGINLIVVQLAAHCINSFRFFQIGKKNQANHCFFSDPIGLVFGRLAGDARLLFPFIDMPFIFAITLWCNCLFSSCHFLEIFSNCSLLSGL